MESVEAKKARLFRNQFSILTPVPVETPAPNLEPPTREEIETVVRNLQADDVEKYKLNEILEGQAAVTETATDTEDVPDPEASEESDKSDESEESEEAVETDVPDYFKKLSERRNAVLSGTKEASATSEKGSTRKRK